MGEDVIKVLFVPIHELGPVWIFQNCETGIRRTKREVSLIEAWSKVGGGGLPVESSY